MKKILVIALLMVFAMAGTALAGGTSSITVTATVSTACAVSGGLAIDFLALDPVLAPFRSQAFISPTVTCNGNTPLGVITDFTGLLAGPSGNIPYTIAGGIIADTTPAVAATALDLMTGPAEIAAGTYTGFLAGDYTETFIITITP